MITTTPAVPVQGPAHDASSHATREMLTTVEVCDELQISRSTFYDWRQKERAPRCIVLPNGSLRVCRSHFENWLQSRIECS